MCSRQVQSWNGRRPFGEVSSFIYQVICGVVQVPVGLRENDVSSAHRRTLLFALCRSMSCWRFFSQYSGVTAMGLPEFKPSRRRALLGVPSCCLFDFLESLLEDFERPGHRRAAARIRRRASAHGTVSAEPESSRSSRRRISADQVASASSSICKSRLWISSPASAARCSGGN